MGWGERFDNLVGVFNPAAGFRRKEIRRLMSRADLRGERSFSAWAAADSDTTRGSRWFTSRLSIDSDYAQDIQTLRANAREAVKNDPYAVSFVEAFVTNTVGVPIRFQSRIKAVEGDGVLTEANVKKWNAEIEELWKRQSCRLGVNGESLHEIQQLAFRHWAIDGEAILLFSEIDDPGRPLPLAVQVIDPARLETPIDRYSDPRIVLGVERDAKGRIVAYHFRKGVVGDNVRDSQDSQRVPAERVCHIFDRWHADQTRGIPILAPVLPRLKDIRDYHDALIVLEQVAACFGVVITGGNPYEAATSRQSNTLTDKDGNPVEELRPGGVTYAKTGTQVTGLNPSRSGSQVGQFTDTMLHGVAAGSNSPFELIGKDYSGTTYSSGRLSLIDGRQHYSLKQQRFISGGCVPMSTRFVGQAIAFGLTSIDARDFKARPWLYDRAQWMIPGSPWIDPVKDVQATQMEIDAGLITYADALAQRGYDLDEVLEQRWKEKQKLKEFDLLPEPEPSPGATDGAPQKKQMQALQQAVHELSERLEQMEAKR
jgi:lambda family phage portal protein